MVGLKVLTIACLIAAVYSNPTFNAVKTIEKGPVNGVVKNGVGGLAGGLLNTAGNIVGGVLNTAGGVVGGTAKTAGNIVGGVLGGGGGALGGGGGLLGGGGGLVNGQVGANVGLGLGGVLQPLIGALTGVTGNAVSLLKDLANLKIPGTVDDVLNVLITVGASVGEIVNVILPGTGTALGNLVIGLAKILICGLGSPGLTGAIIGDHRPGYDNPADIPAICLPSFGGKYGVKGYKGSYGNTADVYNHYDLANLDNVFRAALRKYTNGQGIDGLTGSQKYITQWILQLTGLVKQHPKGDFSKNDLNTLATLLVKILGGIGNSYQTGLGDKIAEQLVKYLSQSIGSNGNVNVIINIGAQLPEIKKDIGKCSRNNLGGAIKGNNGNQANGQNNGQSNTNNNSQTNEDNQNNGSEGNSNEDNQQTDEQDQYTSNGGNSYSQYNQDQSSQSSEENSSNEQYLDGVIKGKKSYQ